MNDLAVSGVKTQSMIQHLRRLYSHISKRRRVQFGFLLVLMIMTSFAEVFSIGAVLPLLTVLTAPEQVFEHAAAQPFIRILELSSSDQLLLPITIAFSVAALVAGSMRLFLLWVITRLAFATGADLTLKVYRTALYQPYLVHVARNSSTVINTMVTKVNMAIQGTIIPLLTIFSSVSMLIVTLSFLFAIQPQVTLIVFGGFGIIYIVIIMLTTKKLISDGRRIAKERTQVIRLLQEGLGGIRDVLLDGTQEIYCKIFRKSDLPLRRAQGNITFIGLGPRFGIEAVGMVFLSFVAYFLAQMQGGITLVIPVIGILALGAQRLLPVLQQAYGAWSSMQGARASVMDTLDFLDQTIPDYADNDLCESVPYQHKISFKKLSFRYGPNEPWVIKNIDLTIAKGTRVGFIGATGSGKSTLTDIIMSLLRPTNGALVIDDEPITSNNFRSWQRHIAHVPQTIFLSDSSIEENIALGIPKDKIDFNRVCASAKRAQISSVIESWPKQYQTFVGERGIRLSGGQRQRIGIARALYKKADVIIFDEATSALDNDTENEVMQAIHDLGDDLTVIIVTHRLTTLRNCSQIIEMDAGGIKQIGTYNNIISKIAV